MLCCVVLCCAVLCCVVFHFVLSLLINIATFCFSVSLLPFYLSLISRPFSFILCHLFVWSLLTSHCVLWNIFIPIFFVHSALSSLHFTSLLCSSLKLWSYIKTNNTVVSSFLHFSNSYNDDFVTVRTDLSPLYTLRV